MTSEFVPPHPRNPGDAWVHAEDGSKYWGRFGAAGLLVVDADRGILLQHRALWSHFGGTWGLPGGARHEGEGAVDGAIREANEEAAVPTDALRPRFSATLDLDIWSYVTVVADAIAPFDPRIADPESLDVRWVPLDEVDTLPLHPGFESAWPALRRDLDRRPVLVVDMANVVGSRPDGWWNDRAGAADRLGSQLQALAMTGLPAEQLGLPQSHWWPDVVAVLEGRANEATVDDAERFSVVRSSTDGDSRIVTEVSRLMAEPGASVTVVTSDRGLRVRVEALGAVTRGAGWLRELLDGVPGGES
ncbi:8-oxo-dGTP pyrophosphatase MutT (NUDIX family) [Okibacterium sp. HSC-33S16]|uniref:NUDIX domain-containing protein n=1 Tax=Okibacterium sp. HSC-33S16 TaxID=2910965 RepID=UPI0020A0BDD6|nr:NUDIX hydrolase [Okibacterium sp. HSC-33S16]MCP2032571.1 8-oxo-dGTP pyrophosphatase MutT (NUDIX family) [Okibacterium sp. HSC-33S16]